MFPKVVILLVCLSVVKAVYTVNAYEDDKNAISGVSEESAVRTPRSCGYEECNVFCRKMGYARGVCIGNYCQCRSRSSAYVARAVEIPKPEMSDVPDGDESAVWTERSCGYAECNEFCRKLGFARGVCIGTYCQCRALIRAPEIPKPDKRYVADASEDPIVSICQVSECNRYCHKRGYGWGVCVSDTRCECRMTLTDKSPRFTNDETPEASALKSCSLQDCEQSCRRRRIGFPGGACVKGRCECDILRSASPLSESDLDNIDKIENDAKHEDNAAAGDDSSENSVVSDDIAEPAPRALKDCNLRVCEQSCRRMGFPGGVCVNGQCKCDILRSALPAPAPILFDDNIAEIENDAIPEDDAAAAGDDSSENNVD